MNIQIKNSISDLETLSNNNNEEDNDTNVKTFLNIPRKSNRIPKVFSLLHKLEKRIFSLRRAKNKRERNQRKAF